MNGKANFRTEYKDGQNAAEHSVRYVNGFASSSPSLSIIKTNHNYRLKSLRENFEKLKSFHESKFILKAKERNSLRSSPGAKRDNVYILI